MNEERFWGLVQAVDWSGLCAQGRRPYEAGKKRMFDLLPTLSDMKAFRQTYQQVTCQLSEALERWEKDGEDWTGDHNPRHFPCSDDSWSDLLAHIVGLGREEYDACVADPERAHKRATAYDYTESFSYCIPYESEYDSPEVKAQKAAEAKQAALQHQQDLVESLSEELMALQETLYTEKNKLAQMRGE